MIRDYLKRIKRIVKGIYRWRVYRKKLTDQGFSKGKVVYFDLSENKFERYLYLLVKFFLLEGYTVFFKRNFHFLGDLEFYSMWLLEENGILFCSSPPPSSIVISDHDGADQAILSYDYFTSLHHTGRTFHVPMTMHPQAYKNGYWNESGNDQKRFQSVFFAGSFKEKAYRKPAFKSTFGIQNRIELLEEIKKMEETIIFASKELLDRKTTDKKICIVDRAHFSLPEKQLNHYLYRYDFFLALPGVSMPFSHNVIEAMSCGCIPIIERGYAELFIPPLADHKTALIFDHEKKSVRDVINEAFQLDQITIGQLREWVQEYYMNYLTPQRVIHEIVVKRPSKIYLLAESYSVSMFNPELPSGKE